MRARNSQLKEYEIVFKQGPVFVELAVDDLVSQDDSYDADSENLFRPLTSGAYEEEDARDTLRVALDWMRRQLAAIESEWRKPRDNEAGVRRGREGCWDRGSVAAALFLGFARELVEYGLAFLVVARLVGE